jgi:molybdopterin-guanine dinucleotide biosynthesis protein A
MSQLESERLPPVYIIAGGRSQRFPGDKALARIEGQPQIIRLIQQFSLMQYSVSVVADSTDRYEKLDVQCLQDIRAGIGPMGGLITSLADRLNSQGPGWILLIGCDQLLWKHQWTLDLRQLWQEDLVSPYLCGLWTQSTKDSASTLPANLKASPIPGLYHTGLIPLVERLAADSRIAMRHLVEHSGSQPYFFPTSAPPSNFSFNTPEDLRQLLAEIHVNISKNE